MAKLASKEPSFESLASLVIEDNNSKQQQQPTMTMTVESNSVIYEQKITKPKVDVDDYETSAGTRASVSNEANKSANSSCEVCVNVYVYVF